MPHRDDETRSPLSENNHEQTAQHESDQGQAARSEMERRKFLKIVGGSLGGAVALGAGISRFSSKSVEAQVGHHQGMGRSHFGMKHRRHGWTSHGGGLAKFVDALPVPATIAPVALAGRTPLFEVSMREFRQKLHRDLPATTLWGYNGMYPGPTFEARRGRPIAVRWRNELPTSHMLQIAPNRRHPRSAPWFTCTA